MRERAREREGEREREPEHASEGVRKNAEQERHSKQRESQRQAPVYHAFHFIYRVSFFSHFVSCLNMTQSVDPAVSSGARKTYGSFNAAIS